jgi:hypothetical protein
MGRNEDPAEDKAAIKIADAEICKEGDQTCDSVNHSPRSPASTPLIT